MNEHDQQIEATIDANTLDITSILEEVSVKFTQSTSKLEKFRILEESETPTVVLCLSIPNRLVKSFEALSNRLGIEATSVPERIFEFGLESTKKPVEITPEEMQALGESDVYEISISRNLHEALERYCKLNNLEPIACLLGWCERWYNNDDRGVRPNFELKYIELQAEFSRLVELLR